MSWNTYVVDENIAIWTETLCHVHWEGNRFRETAPRVNEERAARLVIGVSVRPTLRFGLSQELLDKYVAKSQALRQSSVIPVGQSIVNHINRARNDGRLDWVATPNDVAGIGEVPSEDRFLVKLCAHLRCTLVTEDAPLRTTLKKANLAGKLGLRIMNLDEALETLRP